MYKNPNYKKVKGSYMLLVSCGYCKTHIAKYQKLGKGNVLRLHVDRIIELSTDLSQDLVCPNCSRVLGRKAILKKENKEFYKMIRSSFNTRRLGR